MKNRLPPDAITPAQIAALDALAAAATPAQAAQAAGATLAELLGWLELPAVIAEQNRRRRLLAALRRDRLRALAGQALDLLAELVSAPDATPADRATRLRAAESLLRAAESLEPDGGPEDAAGVERSHDLNRLLRGL